MGVIYKITNIQNGKFYTGSTYNFNTRKKGHINKLKTNKHPNKYLQNIFNKYGLNVFLFEIIEECDNDELLIREQHYIDLFKPEYNICKVAGSWLGIKRGKMSLEHKEKLSKAHKGKQLTKEHKKNISSALKTIYNGEKNNNAKLNWEQVKNIRTEYNNDKKITHQNIANKYGVSRTTITLILNNKVWSENI